MVAQVIKNQIEKIEYREKKIFWILFFVFASLLISYGFLVNKTIGNVIAEQNMQKQISSLSSNVDSLDSQYLALEDSITMDFATTLGYVSVPEDNFAVIGGDKNSSALSLNEN